MSPDAVLAVEDLHVEFRVPAQTVHAVRGVSLALQAGQTLAILGESGSGKSVSALAMMGMIEPPGYVTAGSVSVQGRDLLSMDPSQRRALRGTQIAMIFQDALSALNPVRKVGWQIAEMFRAHRGYGRRTAHAHAVELMERVGIDNASLRANDYPHQLSGGMRQRVLIAIAIALEPDVLIADEPTTALDVTVQAQILALLKDLQRASGMGVVFVTHDIGVVRQVADRVAVMQAGRIVETGDTDRVLDASTHPYTQTLVTARASGQAEQMAPADSAAPMVEVEGLVKQYAVRRGVLQRQVHTIDAVDSVSFRLQPGQTLGIVGESGCGKSTLARSLVGLETPTTGHVRYRGQALSTLSLRELNRVRRKVQMVFQDPYASLNPRMQVRDLITEPLRIHTPAKRPVRESRLRDLLDRVGLATSLAERYPHQLSGGQRQRVGIARALALEPEVLILDEPVSALDVPVQAQIVNLLQELQDALGYTYVFIAHDLKVVQDISDELAVMYQGRFVEYGRAARIYNAPAHPYTQTLLAAAPR